MAERPSREMDTENESDNEYWRHDVKAEAVKKLKPDPSLVFHLLYGVLTGNVQVIVRISFKHVVFKPDAWSYGTPCKGESF